MDLNKMVLYRLDGNVAILEVNNPPVNAMRCDIITGLQTIISNLILPSLAMLTFHDCNKM